MWSPSLKKNTELEVGLTSDSQACVYFKISAEYQYVRNTGADAVGMSTVPEVIVARHMDIPCFAISIITDLGVPGKIQKVSVQDVIEVAGKQEPKMTLIMKELISRI